MSSLTTEKFDYPDGRIPQHKCTVTEKQRSGEKSSTMKAIKHFFSKLLTLKLSQKLHVSDKLTSAELPENPPERQKPPGHAARLSEYYQDNEPEPQELSSITSESLHKKCSKADLLEQSVSSANCCLYQDEESRQSHQSTSECSEGIQKTDIQELLAQNIIDLERLEINARGADKADKKKCRTEPYPKINNNHLQNGGKCFINLVPEPEEDVENYMIPLPVCNLAQNNSMCAVQSADLEFHQYQQWSINKILPQITTQQNVPSPDLRDAFHPNLDTLLNADINFSSPDDVNISAEIPIPSEDLFIPNLLSVEANKAFSQADNVMCTAASGLALLSADFVGNYLKQIEGNQHEEDPPETTKTCYNIRSDRPSVSTEYSSCSSVGSPDVDSGYNTGSPGCSSNVSSDTDYTYRTLGNMYISDEDEYVPSVIPHKTAIQAVQEIADKKPKVKRRLWTAYSLETASFFLTPDEKGLNLIQFIIKNETTDILIKIFAAVTNLIKCASPQVVKEAFEREPRVLTLAQKRRIPLLREYLKEVIEENEKKLAV